MLVVASLGPGDLLMEESEDLLVLQNLICNLGVVTASWHAGILDGGRQKNGACDVERSGVEGEIITFKTQQNNWAGTELGR